MAKHFICLCLLCSLIFTACTPPSQRSQTPFVPHTPTAKTNEGDSGILVIDEPFFDAQCRDIFDNPGDYAGKTIRIEGMYFSIYDDHANTARPFVLRYHPDGCCGNGTTGLEFRYDGDLPAENDWIEVTGMVEVLPIEPYPVPFTLLVATSVVVKEERGNEHVLS